MSNDLPSSVRPLGRSVSVWTVIVLGGLMAWAYARSGPEVRPRARTAAPVTPTVPAKTSAANEPDADVRGIPVSTESKPSGRLIETLRQQVAQSPLLQDADAQSSILQSLDQAGDIWTKAHRQNREALRQLKRQVRIGESRQAPNLVLITFDRTALDDQDSPRARLFQELAKRGVSFPQHYAGGESPTSGWWTLMTGRNTGRARTDATRFQLRAGDPTVATALWQAGYTTGFVGHWDDGVAPPDSGFDNWTGLMGSKENLALFPTVLLTARSKMTISANANGQKGASLWKLLDVEIASFLTDHARQTRPFFLQVRLPDLPVDPSAEPTHSGEDTAERVVQQVFDHLGKAGIEQQTCVFLTALAGREVTSTRPLSEAALRIPFVMVGGPGMSTGTTITEPSAAWDLLPTLLDIARATSRTTKIDGRSLVTNENGRSLNTERLLYWESDRAGAAQAVRKGPWKGAAKAGERRLRLYDVESDPAQEKDVATDHPDVVQQLLAPAPPAAATEAASAKPDRS